MRRPLIRDLVRLALGGIIGGLAVTGYAAWRVWEQGERDERRPADAIVVLGAAQDDGRPSPVFQARLEHAVALHQAGLAPFLVVTGGKRPGDRVTEAEAARAWAMARGVDPARILVEDRGRTTLESLRAAAALLRSHGIRDVVCVSDRAHMLRVLRIARDEGLDAFGSPTRTSPTDLDPRRRIEATAHELAALALYFVTGDLPPGEPPPAAETPHAG